MRFFKWRIVLVFSLCLFAFLYVLPTFVSVSKIKPTWLANILPHDKINLGLDLAGGVHIVMGIRKDATLEATAQRDAEFLQRALKEDLVEKVEHIPQTVQIRVVAKSEDKVEQVRTEVRKAAWFLSTHEVKGKEIVFTYKGEYEAQVLRQALDQTVQRIGNRIDEFGVAEPSIQTQGRDRIVIQIPGYKDPKAAKDIIGRTAQLEFRMVLGVPTGQLTREGKPVYDSRFFIAEKTKTTAGGRVNLAQLVDQVQKENGLSFKEVGEKDKTEQTFSEFVQKVNKALEGKIPQGYEVLFEKQENQETGEVVRIPYLVTKEISLTGDNLKNAYVQPNPQTNEPVVGFQFGGAGSKILADLTKPENHGKQMAVILDGVIKSAPSIAAHLTNGQGIVTLGAGTYEEKQKEAQNVAIVLRAGALPAPLDFLFERTVGPSLGRDSIESSEKAFIAGSLFVFIFMIIYYSLSGIVAIIALLLNVLFILAALAMLNATLTLPGIAGIILTIGMAVDANVLVYERMREELDKGKTPNAAIEAGFTHAWWTVFDSNLTTIMPGFVLLKYGTGSVKGFAITLIIGVISSVFTAFYVSKLIFSGVSKGRTIKKLYV